MTLESAGAQSPEIAALGPWFHNLHLPGGEMTAPDHPLGDFPAYKWRQIGSHLPQDLRGWHALDIGCNAGFYSFALAARGADVVGIDHDEHYLRQARWAASRFDVPTPVEFRNVGVYDLDSIDETFDLVLFMGVLYHLRYPLLALDLVAERVRGRLVVQTLTMPGDELEATPPDLSLAERERLRSPEWPAMAFVEHQFAGDPTNWWVPNASAVAAMLRTAGMRIVDRPGHEMWICERSRETHHADELAQATGRSRRGASLGAAARRN